MSRSRFFRYAYIFTVGFIAGLLCYPYFFKPQKIYIEVPKIKVMEKYDTIPITRFKMIQKNETIFVSKPIIWKQYEYRDSFFEVNFEADTFRNFRYTLKKEIFTKREEILKEKMGDFFVATDFHSLYSGVSYKFLKFGLKYDFKKSFKPFVGVRLQF